MRRRVLDEVAVTSETPSRRALFYGLSAPIKLVGETPARGSGSDTLLVSASEHQMMRTMVTTPHSVINTGI